MKVLIGFAQFVALCWAFVGSQVAADPEAKVLGASPDDSHRALTVSSSASTGSNELARTCQNSLLSSGAAMNIGIVIDISYSTISTKFGGTPSGDVNNDGVSDTVMDAEIDSVLKLLDKILGDPKLKNADILLGFVLFHTEATYHGTFKPLSDDKNSINSDLMTFLKGIKCPVTSTDAVTRTNNGFTNMDDALDKAILFFEDPVVDTSKKNILIFLSDGEPNVRGDGDNEPWCSYTCRDCNLSPKNKVAPAGTPIWEQGQLSFCFAGDKNCGANQYAHCARGVKACENTPPVMDFRSELKRLDDFDVIRLAIGVGGLSDPSKGGALDMIDNTPDESVVPLQAFTSESLNDAMRTLCIEGTSPPTISPATPPTEPPTNAPTLAPIDQKGCEIRSVLSKPPINLAIAIDISMSTYYYTFSGTPVGDVNMDGKANTILDAEIQAIIDLLFVILEDPELNNANVNIGFIPFETDAFYKGRYLPLGHYLPLNSAGTDINRDLVTALKAIRTSTSESELLSTNIGFTNFDDALDKTIDYYIDLGDEVSKRSNVLIFLSDGFPTVRGDGDDEPWCRKDHSQKCSKAPANMEDAPGTYPWNRGQRSYCLSGESTCTTATTTRNYVYCVRGRDQCQGEAGSQTFDSELEKLDEMKVMRIAMGFGAEADTREGSAMDKIDSFTSNDPLSQPALYMNTDDLRTALKKLCVEGDPSEAPSVLVPEPSAVPTKSPTKTPTWSPTSSPTEEEEVEPSCMVASMFKSAPLNLAIVVDISYNTYKEDFAANVGDVNGDGKANTVLDAEIQSIIELIEIISNDASLNNDNVDIGIILFDTEAQYKGEFVSSAHYAPKNANGNGPNEVLIQHLLSIRSVITYNKGYSNFDDALDKAIEYFEDSDTSRNNVMVFMASGVPNVRGDGDAEPWCNPESCGSAPANIQDGVDTPAWEKGQLSFCGRNDSACLGHFNEECARGFEWCPDKKGVMSFDSELAQLDTYHVNRIAIGVGGSSEVTTGSALDLIDNNPNKANGGLPPQVFDFIALKKALKSICLDNTRPPTRSPTPAPLGLSPPTETNEPTSVPGVSACEDEVVLIKQVGSTSPGTLPITITERNENTITFTIRNEWTEELDHMYIQFYGLDRSEECWKKDTVSKSDTFTFTTYCWKNVPITLVSIWVSDSIPGALLDPVSDNAVVPECCGGPDVDTNPKVLYAFKVSCYCVPSS